MKVCLKKSGEFPKKNEVLVIKKFLQFLQSQAPLNEEVRITFTDSREIPMTTGVRMPDNEIVVLAKGRLLIDILRTISHEWVHEFQYQKMGVRDDVKNQDIGGPEENMCNILSGIFIKKFEKKYPDQNNVPRPLHWSGWRILPAEIEFWVDGEGRIHERLNYKNKKEAQMLFLDFWKIPKQDSRRARQGIYFEETQLIEDKSVQIIGLDTRYFRSKLEGRKNGYLPNNDPRASVLGTEQWKWLDETLENSKADIIIILSSIQVLATNHPYEKWSNFTADRKKLLKRLNDVLKTKTVVLISGDRHRAGLYQKGGLVEITASALNKGSSRPTETDPLLVGKTYPKINFGILDIQPSKNIITLSINDKDGIELESKVINLQ